MLRKKRRDPLKIKGFYLRREDIERLEYLWRLARKEFPAEEYGAVRYSEIIRACLEHAAKTVRKRGIRQLFN